MIPSASSVVAAFARATHQQQTPTPSPPSQTPSPDHQEELSATQMRPVSSQPAPSSTIDLPKQIHCTHNFLKIANRARIFTWMFEESIANVPPHIASRAVRQFPALFRRNKQANLQKSSRLWRRRAELSTTKERFASARLRTFPSARFVNATITRVTKNGIKEFISKREPVAETELPHGSMLPRSIC